MSSTTNQIPAVSGTPGSPQSVTGVEGTGFVLDRRLPELDGIRGCAILLVIMWHYLGGLLQPETGLGYLRQALWLTWSGVDLFFVLSGFLITGILLDNRGASNYFKVFYIRRACRIWPLYYALLIGFVFFGWLRQSLVLGHLDWLFNKAMPLWSYATFTQNFIMSERSIFGAGWLGITWSLAVEEQFYLVLPPLVYFLPRRILPYLFGLFIVCAPFIRGEISEQAAIVHPLARADSLIGGALLAWVLRYTNFGQTAAQRLKFLYLIFGLFLVGTLFLNWRGGRIGGGLTHFWLAGFYSTFLLLAVIHKEGLLSRILKTRILVWFGVLSYGIYMLHQAVNGLVHGLINASVPQIRNMHDAVLTLLAFVITLVLAACSYYFIEKKILRYGHSFHYERREVKMAGSNSPPVSGR